MAGDVDTNLAARECVPCKKGAAPLAGADLEALLRRLGGGWRVSDAHHLEKRFEFSIFVDALAFTNRVGEMAEEQGHHPDIHLAWGKVGIEIWTHKINGLHESDFVFAAKCDVLYRRT